MNLKVFLFCTYVLTETEFSVVVFGRKVYKLLSCAERDLNLHYKIICYSSYATRVLLLSMPPYSVPSF